MKFLATKFAQVNANISETQAQIAALQTKLSELQDYHQHLLLVEQACESVLEQMETAFAMLNNVDPTQIAIFKAAIELNFTSPQAINIFEPTAPIEAATPKPTTHTEPEVFIEQEVQLTLNTQLETNAINILEPVSGFTEPPAPRLIAPTTLEAPVESNHELAIKVEVMSTTDEQSDATPEVMSTTDEQSDATPEAMPTPDRIARRYSRK